MKALLTKLAVGIAGVGLSLIAGAGVASAAPNLDSMVNTTCSYPQVMSAMNAQDPAAAAQFTSTPQGESLLHQFLGSPPDQRRQMVNLMASHPANQPFLGLAERVFNTCNNY